MYGIDLNAPITYESASFRYFRTHEHHVRRLCPYHVLLLVFDGVLRFSEDGTEYEIHAGEYFIQREGGFQEGRRASDAPKYLYIHFHAAWSEGESSLPHRGEFDVNTLYPVFEKMDAAYHEDKTLTAQCALFFNLLHHLHEHRRPRTQADELADYIARFYPQKLTLTDLAEHFHFSKNHIIHLFRRHYGMTPVAYITAVRIAKAQRLLITTSRTAEEIALECGFSDYAHFYRAFTKKNRLSPAAWRKEKRSE